MRGVSVATIFLWITSANCLSAGEYDSESLGPVISMIEKRERELEPLYVYEREPEEEIIFVPEEYGQPEDIGYGYQKSALSSDLANFKEHYPELTNEELEKLMLDYLEKGRPKENYYVYGKTKKSVFRERDENELPERLQHMQGTDDDDSDDDERLYKEQAFYRNQSPFRERFREVDSKENNRHVNNADLEYLSALNTLWEQYQHKQDLNDNEAEDSNDINRNDNIELSEDDIAAILSYFEDKNDDDPRQLDETFDRNNENNPLYYKTEKNSKHHQKSIQKRIWRDGAFERYAGYDKPETFLIKKRSLKNILHEDLKRKKKATESKQKNPSTDKELNKIFGESEKKNGTEEKSKESKTTATTVSHKSPTTVKTTEKPILLKKKSVDWSHYFGIDKRKKKSFNKKRANDDWLVEQYMNQYEPPRTNNKDIDAQFRDMEDMILDQVIKYTGAHEGVNNPEQLHRIKQKILSQLAAAYSLEKMRRALYDYKSSAETQNLDNNRFPEKRFLKKQTIEPKDSGVTLEEESNNIPETAPHEQHPKKSFFRRNSPKFAQGYSI